SVDTVVSYTVGGTATSGSDYTAFSGSVTILADNGRASSSERVTDDILVEPTETVTIKPTGMTGVNTGVTLDETPSNLTASLDVTDNDTATVSVATTTSSNETGPVNVVVTVTQTKVSSVDTVVSYSIGGTATSGSDYTALSGSVTILA